MNTDILFQNLSENPAFNTPVAEKTINEIKILDLRYTEEIDIIFMTSHVAKVKYGKKFNPNNSKQILSIIAPCFNYGGIIDKEGNILLTEELTKKIKEQTVEIGENSLISDSPNKIVDSLEKELETKTNQHEERNNQQLNLFNDLRERGEEIPGNKMELLDSYCLKNEERAIEQRNMLVDEEGISLVEEMIWAELMNVSLEELQSFIPQEAIKTTM